MRFCIRAHALRCCRAVLAPAQPRASRSALHRAGKSSCSPGSSATLLPRIANLFAIASAISENVARRVTSCRISASRRARWISTSACDRRNSDKRVARIAQSGSGAAPSRGRCAGEQPSTIAHGQRRRQYGDNGGFANYVWAIRRNGDRPSAALALGTRRSDAARCCAIFRSAACAFCAAKDAWAMSRRMTLAKNGASAIALSAKKQQHRAVAGVGIDMAKLACQPACVGGEQRKMKKKKIINHGVTGGGENGSNKQ